MIRHVMMIWLLAAAIVLGALGWTISLAVKSHGHATVAAAQLRTVSEQAKRVSELRALGSLPSGRDGAAPLAERVTAALSSAGLPSSVLSNFSPESESVDRTTSAGTPSKRRRATMTLAPITLPQVGTFLAAWKDRQPMWEVSSVDLSPQSNSAATPGGDLPLRVVIVIQSYTLAEGGGIH